MRKIPYNFEKMKISTRESIKGGRKITNSFVKSCNVNLTFNFYNTQPAGVFS